jgi:hypothetical protein
VPVDLDIHLICDNCEDDLVPPGASA